MNDSKLAYGVEEAKEVLGLTRTRIYKVIAEGALDSYLEGKRRMVSRRAIEKYLAAKEREAQGRAAA